MKTSQCIENFAISSVFSPCIFAVYLCPKTLSMQLYNDTTLTVRNIPNTHFSAAFTIKTSEVFKEEHEVAPVWINDRMQYVPWGADNQMPFNIIDLVESDETLATCQICRGVLWVWARLLAPKGRARRNGGREISYLFTLHSYPKRN